LFLSGCTQELPSQESAVPTPTETSQVENILAQSTPLATISCQEAEAKITAHTIRQISVGKYKDSGIGFLSILQGEPHQEYSIRSEENDGLKRCAQHLLQRIHELNATLPEEQHIQITEFQLAS
jgi:hypothetical protein